MINRSHKLLSIILSLILFTVAITGYNTTAFAQSVDDLKDKISSYQDKIAAAQEKLDALDGDISKVKEYLAELDSQVAMYQDQIDAYNDEIDGYNKQVDSYNDEKQKLEDKIDELNEKIEGYNKQIDQLNVQIDGKYDELKELIRSNYVNGETSSLEVLLCADDFSQYLTKVQFVSSLADYEKDLVDSINKDIDSVNDTIAKVDAEKADIKDIQAQIDEKIAKVKEIQETVEEDKAKVKENQDKIQEKVDENKNYLSNLRSQSAEFDAMISSYEDSIEEYNSEIESMIRQQASSGSGTLVNSSGLICPLQYSGAYLSSGYYRNSDGSYHGAYDICVAGGTSGCAISAAESGTVVTASYHWSYGNYVIIDHGNGLSTLYAHCSSLAVSAGQTVSKGQTIAYAGSTGNAFGAHLHFEVRINGTRTNPGAYISIP